MIRRILPHKLRLKSISTPSSLICPGIKAIEEKKKLEETRSKFAPKIKIQFQENPKNSSAVSINDAQSLTCENKVFEPPVF